MIDQAQPAIMTLFCKQPVAGYSKQRIAASLGKEKTLQIAQALFACAKEDLQAWTGTKVISPSAEHEQVWAQQQAPDAEVKVQPPGNLGERINQIDQQLRSVAELGELKHLIIGSDAPILSERFYQAALTKLDAYDVVLSHADDGGVTLMAASVPWPELKDLSWSTEKLGSELVDLCERKGLNVAAIEPSFDIDHEADLIKLQPLLLQDKRPARQQLLQTINALQITGD